MKDQVQSVSVRNVIAIGMEKEIVMSEISTCFKRVLAIELQAC